MYVLKLLMLIVLFAFVQQSNGMSEAQLKATAKLIRNVCQPKTKATNEDIEKMHKGDWEIDNTAKCYMHCVMSMLKLLTKEAKLDYDSVLVQIKTLPEPRRDSTLKCTDQCKDAIKSDDKCIAGYEQAKCFYFCDAENYFLP